MEVRFGIMGVGWWTRNVHIPNLLRVADARIVALCSRSKENREAGAKLCSGQPRLFERYEDMLACDEVDAVIVSTPNVFHAEQAAAALRAGKHVLCEKPLALTRKDARLVTQAAAGSERVVAAGYELRSADVSSAVREAVCAGRVGAPLMVMGRFWRSWGPMTRGWRGEREMSGGPVPELFSHTADLQAYLMGEAPQTVYGKAGAIEGPPYWDRVSVISDYPCGAVGVANMCLVAWGMKEDYPVEVVGEDGRLVGDVVKGELTLWPKGGGEPQDLSPRRSGAPLHGFPGSQELVQEFTDCVSGRRPAPRCGLADAIATCAICLAVEQSIARGRPVRVKV